MPTLLNIQSSPRGRNSISRTLSHDFVTAWQTKHPDGKVVLRDLAENNLPYVGVPWITGIFLPADKHTSEMRRALAVSDELIAELFLRTRFYRDANVQLHRPRQSEGMDRPHRSPPGYPLRSARTQRVVVGKTCKIIIASGGTYDEGLPASASDYESGYLKRILAFIGIAEVEIILAGGTAAVSFGSSTLEELTAQFRSFVVAAAR